MNFPFVTRRAFKMLEEQRDELKRELADLRARNDDLINQFSWRSTGVALYPEKLPADYRQTKKEIVDPAQVLTDPKEKPEPVLSPRAALRKAEESRQKEFDEQQGRIHEVKEA